MTAPSRSQPRLPAGLRWSDVWETESGLVRGDRELPVDATTLRISGRLYLCQRPECQTEEWIFGDQTAGFCPRDGSALAQTRLDPSEPDVIGSARAALATRVRSAVATRRDRIVAEAAARAAALRAEAEAATRQTAGDMRGHVPSLVATGAGMAGAVTLASTTNLLVTAGVGIAVLTAGTVGAYTVAYHILMGKAKAGEVTERVARKIRSRARQIGGGVSVLGGWTVLISITGVNPAHPAGAAALLAGCVAAWAANRTHWDALWAERRRLRGLERLRAENAARRAQEEANQLAAAAPATPTGDADSTAAAGRRMAAEWARISVSQDVPSGFRMRQTRILPGETRELTIPDPGGPVRIGYEFAGTCDPGVLVARTGMQPPLLAAATWLASMLQRDPSTVSVVDSPTDDGGQRRPNRFLVLLTDRAPLGAAVQWKGKAGVKTAADGTITVHGGRTLTGVDVDEVIYSPGKPFGGLVVGTTGGGKSAGTILKLLNCLAAGVFPILDDPKQLVDYADFVGVFPIGVTEEHTKIILRSLQAERQRRERVLATRPITDRHGRTRTAAANWSLADGPPILAFFEEFHTKALLPWFHQPLTEQARLQRAAAMGIEAITQGGGLADLQNSVLRSLLAMVCLRIYRTTDASASLAGYRGTHLVSSLPRVPGVRLDVSEEAPPLPLRAAYVTRDDVPGCVYDELYTPDMKPLLTPPPLPAGTLDVFLREGLIDLWELGKGPSGLANLLGDTANYAPTAHATTSGIARMAAADVILAIAHTTPGCARAAVDASPAWTTAPGWTAAPAPSTISRAAKALEGDGLLSRAGDAYTVTNAGMGRAVAAVTALFGAPVVEELDDNQPDERIR